MTQAILKDVIKGLTCRAANMKDKRCEYCPYGVMLGNSGWGCDLVTMCRDAIELLAEWRKAAEPQMETLKALEDVRAYARECNLWLMDAAASMAAFQIAMLSGKVMALEAGQEPHVVTIADYADNPNVDKDGNLAVWRESRHFPGIAYHEDGWTVLNRDRVDGWFNSEAVRFWTSRPTAERMAAKPWGVTE